MADLALLPGVSADYVERRLGAAAGKEIESGKFASPDSSAALVANCFGWFVEQPQALPAVPGVTVDWLPQVLDIEYCARFPWRGGRHPWLDAFVETEHAIIGIESKRYEPFRDAKTVSLSEAYDRPCWGDGMAPFELMRDALRDRSVHFRHLDAAQLVKHAFGLVTEAGRKHKAATLLYLFAEPVDLPARGISPETMAVHRSEIAAFAAAVEGAAVRFAAVDYRKWLDSWTGGAREHAERLREHFRL